MSPVDVRWILVQRVVAVTRRVQDATDPIGIEARARLARTSGLSAEGVEIALSECLETQASRDDVTSLIRRVGEAPRTWVVASANVCTAAARAIALAAATSRRVLVRPSRRDPVLAEILVRELGADETFAAFAAISLVEELAPTPGDEVHAYGRDETIAAIAASLPEGVAFRGHGTGFGVAVVEESDDVAVASAQIARDVVRLDQRGCLSPRAVLVEGGAQRLHATASALATELASLRDAIPPGAATLEERAELALFRRSMESIADVYGDEWAMTVATSTPSPLHLPPAARTLMLIGIAVDAVEPDAVEVVMKDASRFVAAIGTDNGNGRVTRVLTSLAPFARVSRLGEMQRPRLDGPVDLRHLRD